ncbi:hypothetical protein [Mycoplasmopsis primatum]|uniref:hypothetical protein n=1 Tax=Mycoplasmopsis primatum TaxID=55604 RepID=UPI0004973A6D|nr:hypothetical protein [Mycoplasmopsis primatum]
MQSNNLPYNFQSKLTDTLIKSNVANLLSDVEKQMLNNTYLVLFNSYYGANNHQAQTYYVNDPNFYNYLNQYAYSYFYNQINYELNKKMWDFHNRMQHVIYMVNKKLYNW